MPKVNIHITNGRSMPNKKRLFPCNLVAGVFAPAAGRQLIDSVGCQWSFKAYQLLPSVRGNSLVELGRFAEAQAQFQRVSWCKRLFDERIGFPWEGQSASSVIVVG